MDTKDYVHLLIGVEKEKYWDFRQKHWEKCKNSGHYIIDLLGTGIGETISVCCPYCEETEDITDINAW